MAALKRAAFCDMRVLLVHNRYQQRGGEDAVVVSERNLLAGNGFDIDLLETNNDAIAGVGGKLAAAAAVFYSPSGVHRLTAALQAFRPDVVHVHNWFPTLSPGIFWACRNRGVAVVHTLHNYRLLCVNSALFRNGGACEDCVQTTFRSPGIVHACYRGSRVGSLAATAGMLAHWRAGTWRSAVDRYIALSRFAKNKMIEGGLPADTIVIKPNFLDRDPGPRGGQGGYLAFVGRLTEEKGVRVLLECWKRHSDLPPLHIVGAGPLEDEVRAAESHVANLRYLGLKSSDEVLEIMGAAIALLCPSLWYEGMPRVVVEALAVGTPVIASRLGTYVEMLEGERGGRLFAAGDPEALADCLRAFAPEQRLALRAAARQEFLARYTAEENLRMLRQIYEDAMALRSSSSGVPIPSAL